MMVVIMVITVMVTRMTTVSSLLLLAWFCCRSPAPGLSDSCCGQEEYYWRNPKAYPQHPPTLLVQPVTDCNADTDAARFYHEAMRMHGGNSAYGSRTRALCSAPEDGITAGIRV